MYINEWSWRVQARFFPFIKQVQYMPLQIYNTYKLTSFKSGTLRCNIFHWNNFETKDRTSYFTLSVASCLLITVLSRIKLSWKHCHHMTRHTGVWKRQCDSNSLSLLSTSLESSGSRQKSSWVVLTNRVIRVYLSLVTWRKRWWKKVFTLFCIIIKSGNIEK